MRHPKVLFTRPSHCHNFKIGVSIHAVELKAFNCRVSQRIELLQFQLPGPSLILDQESGHLDLLPGAHLVLA